MTQPANKMSFFIAAGKALKTLMAKV